MKEPQISTEVAMRLFDNKKGQDITTSKVFYWLIGLIISVLLVYSVWGFGATFFSSLTQTPPQLKEDLFTARVVNTCFSWAEQTTPQQTETHPNILDTSKITNSRLAECFTGQKLSPAVLITIKPLSSQSTIQPTRVALVPPSARTAPFVYLQNKKPTLIGKPQYVLLKNIQHQQVCGLPSNALNKAKQQNDQLFNVAVELTEHDLQTIKQCIEQAWRSGSATGDPSAQCALTLPFPAQQYNSQPHLSDFCYSKAGACTYTDFLIDYKGNCKTTTTTQKELIPATLQAIFYD